MSEVLIQDTGIAARDGYALAATVFAPAVAPTCAVLINSATAVPRKIYRGFATYLAEQVLTYDYRGTGGSRPPSLRGFQVRMRDWAALDVTAAIDHMRAVWPQLRLVAVGHSFGGQALGLAPNNGEDLPRDVFLEWTRWVVKPRYFFDDTTLDSLENFPRYRGALRAICLTDDPWATAAAVDLLCSGFTGTTAERIDIRPGDVGWRRSAILDSSAPSIAIRCGAMRRNGLRPERYSAASRT